MSLAVATDVTRLVMRAFAVTPNGIDRIDAAFARHFLRPEADEARGTIWTPIGPRLLPHRAARDAVAAIDTHWGEDNTGTDAAYEDVVAHLCGRRGRGAGGAPVRHGRRGRVAGFARWFREHGLPLAQGPARDLPSGACYLNVSQFPLWVPSYFEWLEARPDVRAVFFIHDLLPLALPEYFPPAEEERHRKRLATLARFGAGAIVTTETVRADLDAYLGGLGRTLPILVAPTPMSPVFAAPAAPDPRLEAVPYFICCSTMEPRKNHLLLLHVWRDMVAAAGAAAPRLVLVGKRGWQFGAVTDMLARSPAMRSHVVEVGGLTTPGLRRLLAGARALLMPTFGEGYGLPVHEALAAGVPVVASDLPVFREVAGPGLRLLDPIDGPGWRAAIEALTPTAPAARPAGSAVQSWPAYFARVEQFMSAL